MKAPFSKSWIQLYKGNLEAEFEGFNLNNPYIKWQHLNSCKAIFSSDALISYQTFVALRKWIQDENGRGVNVVIARDTYSATTVKHIYTFARKVGAECIIFLNSSKGPYRVALERR